jgi:hypothetical protein
MADFVAETVTIIPKSGLRMATVLMVVDGDFWFLQAL